MLRLLLLLLLKINALTTPPVGNIYSKTIKLPLIGEQYIETKMINKQRAIINLKGIINEKGYAVYYKRKNNIILSKNLIEKMKELKCNFSNPKYNKEKDEVIFRILIKPIYFNKKIILNKEVK